MHYDLNIFNFINGSAAYSALAAAAGIFFANDLAYGLGLLLLFFLFWPKKDMVKNRAMVVLAVTAGLVGRFVVKTAILLF